MIYLKSVLMGLLTAVSGGILAVVSLVVFVRLRFHKPASFGVELIRSPRVWGFLLALFLAGFIFELRRLHALGR